MVQADARVIDTLLHAVSQDFHTVPANSAAEPLEKHYVSSRSRRQKGILVFLARDAEHGVLRFAQAGIPKAQQADQILSFAKFWQGHTGELPAELVFDSQLTTHANLSRLNAQGIHFITLRRRSRKMLSEIYAVAQSAWRRITLDSLTRIYRTSSRRSRCPATRARCAR